MDRKPPRKVREILRREVGFGCPVPGAQAGTICGNPYLYYHHFDPPWHVKEHHNPHGMIALCGEHHPKADAGAFTKEQLRRYKEQAIVLAPQMKGRFDWMRNDLLCIAGGFIVYKTLSIAQYRDTPVIWLNRDEDGYLLLNVHMLTKSKEERLIIEDNSWIATGDPVDLESPPSGKLLSVKYANGDQLRVEFIELTSLQDTQPKFPHSRVDRWGLAYPITAVEVHMAVGDSFFRLEPNYTTFGNVHVTEFFSAGGTRGFYFDDF